MSASERRRLNDLITIRLRTGDRELLAEAAKRYQITVSEFVRTAAIEWAQSGDRP